MLRDEIAEIIKRDMGVVLSETTDKVLALMRKLVEHRQIHERVLDKNIHIQTAYGMGYRQLKDDLLEELK